MLGAAPENGFGPRVPGLWDLFHPLSVYILPEHQSLKRQSSSFSRLPVSVVAAPAPTFAQCSGKCANNVKPKGLTPGSFPEPRELWKDRGAPQRHVPGNGQQTPSICFLAHRTPIKPSVGSWAGPGFGSTCPHFLVADQGVLIVSSYSISPKNWRPSLCLGNRWDAFLSRIWPPQLDPPHSSAPGQPQAPPCLDPRGSPGVLHRIPTTGFQSL